MSNESNTTLEIDSVERYESLRNLFGFLMKLRFVKPKAADLAASEEYGHEFNRCDYCDEPRFDCHCDDYPDYSIDYDFEPVEEPKKEDVDGHKPV